MTAGSDHTERSSRRTAAVRCERCRQTPTLCICADVPSIANRTRVLVLRHHYEAPRPSNTARIAALALQNIDIVEWVPRTPPDVDRLLTGHHPAWVLYPGGGNVDISRERPATLVVLDATWKQARKMLHRHAPLFALPRWELPGPAPAASRLRRAHDPQARSTLEAIADALAILDGPDVGAPLHTLHERLVQRVLRARGLLPSGQT